MEEQKTINSKLRQIIYTVESSLNQKLDVLQSDLDQKINILHNSISRLTNQHVHKEEESPEEDCLSDTMVEEQCLQQLQEGLIENFESSNIGAAVCPWEKKEETSPMLTEEGSGRDAVEELQKHNLHLPSTDQVYILPTPAAHSTPETPTAKVIPFALPALQNFKKLVVTVQTCATTSKTLAVAHTAWHSGWFGCWFKYGAPGPQHLYKLHQFQQPPKA